MALKEIYAFLCYTSTACILIPIIISLLNIKTLSRSLWVLLFYQLLCLLSDVLSLLLKDETDRNILFNVFTVTECLAICTIYSFEYRRTASKIVVSLSILFFLIYAVKKFVVDRAYNNEDENVSAIGAGIVILLSGLYFVKILLDEQRPYPARHYFYWINLGFLIYFSAALLIFKNANFLSTCEERLAFYLYGIHQIANITSNLLFGVGIWKIKPARL